jgi:cell division protein FtsW
MDPWANAYASGYQLTQSLIAFGHGGWCGVGLGKSVQKLFYLPEAHTDFLFAVLSEELGLIGALLVIGLFCLLIYRAFMIGLSAYQQKLYYGAYVAYGLALWLGLQAMISIGVNTGLLPTKGLTLPLMSYGGSSMLINCIVIMLLLRIDHEARIYALGLQHEVWHHS